MSVLIKRPAEFIGKTNDVRSLKNASRYQLGYLSSFFRPRPPIDGNENFLVADGDLKSVRPDGDGVWLDEVLLYLMIRYECRPLRVSSLESLSRGKVADLSRLLHSGCLGPR